MFKDWFFPLLWKLLGFLLVAQMVKNLLAVQETQIQPGFDLGWEDPLEKGKATHFSILAWRILGPYSPWGRKEVGHD